MTTIKSFREIVADCSKESMWELIEVSIDRDMNHQICEDAFKDIEYFSNTFLERILMSDAKARVYLLQWLNMSLCSSSLSLQNLEHVLSQTKRFQNILEHSLVTHFESQFFRFYLMLIFNFLKQMLKIDSSYQINHPLIELTYLERTFVNYTLPVYFSNFNAADHENDVYYEWVVNLYLLLVEHTKSTSSILKWLVDSSQPIYHNVIYDFYIIHIDERIRSKNSYSLVLDMPAILLDSDDDFSARINKEDNSNSFSIKRSDVIHTLDLFYKSANTTSLIQTIDTAHSLIKMLVGITFVGRYNKALQDLILDEDRFLGKLSEMLKIICTAKVKKEERLKRPEICSNIIRLASNLVHANNDAQDFLIKTHYLPFYLSQTNRDEDDMYCKEVTVVFVRYMTESNHAAREYIKQLKVDDFIAQNAHFVNKFDDI